MTKIFLWHFFLPQFCFRLRSQQIILWWYLVQCLYVMTIYFSSLSVCYQRWMLYSEICGCRRGRSSGSCSRHQFKVHHSVSWLWYYTIYITIKRLIFMVHACKFEEKNCHFAGSPIPQESIKSCYCIILCHSWFRWGTCIEMDIAQNQ